MKISSLLLPPSATDSNSMAASRVNTTSERLHLQLNRADVVIEVQNPQAAKGTINSEKKTATKRKVTTEDAYGGTNSVNPIIKATKKRKQVSMLSKNHETEGFSESRKPTISSSNQTENDIPAPLTPIEAEYSLEHLDKDQPAPRPRLTDEDLEAEDKDLSSTAAEITKHVTSLKFVKSPPEPERFDDWMGSIIDDIITEAHAPRRGSAKEEAAKPEQRPVGYIAAKIIRAVTQTTQKRVWFAGEMISHGALLARLRVARSAADGTVEWTEKCSNGEGKNGGENETEDEDEVVEGHQGKGH